MASQSRKHRGYKTQRLVAAYLVARGYIYALSCGAGSQGTDVTGVPGLDIEVKARTGLDLPGLMRQLHARHDNGLMGVGVIRLNGQGDLSVPEYVAVLRLEDFVTLYRAYDGLED